jgi:hypothetical protein
VTVEPGATVVPCGGFVFHTVPGVADELCWVTGLTWKPFCWSVCVAEASLDPMTLGTATFFGPTA